MKNFIAHNSPLVSAIVPCSNEERFIANCLDSIVAQDYPKDKLEVFVVDGMSEDGTRKIIKQYTERFPFINLLDNYKRTTSSAFNRGIKAAKGDIIIIMGSHSTYEKDYMSQCVSYLTNGDANNVGGKMITLPQNDSLRAKSIAFALSNRFGVGNSAFRTTCKSSKYVDTVFGGCYRKELFEKIGLFDEELLRNQDDEFNFRLIRNGGKILLVPEIVSYYYARNSWKNLWTMFFQYGYFKPLVARKVGGFLTWRQTIPALFVGSLIFTGILSFFGKRFLWLFLFVVALYVVANTVFSFSVSLKKGLKLLPFVAISFATLHLSYGIGYLKGIWDFLVLKQHLRKRIKNIKLTR